MRKYSITNGSFSERGRASITYYFYKLFEPEHQRHRNSFRIIKINNNETFMLY